MSECIKEENDCKFCGRAGLPILPVRFAYVPGKIEFRKGEITIESTQAPFVSPMPKAMKNARPFQAGGEYMLRTITEGYIFIWHGDSDLNWSAYDVSRNGLFKEIALEDGDGAKNDTPPKFKCCTPFHQYEASLISIKDPEKKTQPIWIGYSRVWWTKNIRAKLVKDEALRKKLMTPLDAKNLAEGGAPDAKVAYRVDKEGKNISQHIQEYVFKGHEATTQIFTQTHTVPEPGITAGLDRGNLNEVWTAGVMYHISKEHGGIVLALRDPIGVVQDVSAGRNYRLGEFAAYAEPRQHGLFTAQTLKSLEKGMRDSGQGKIWDEKYKPRVKDTEARKLLSDYLSKKWQVDWEVNGLNADWALLTGSHPEWLAALQTYDLDNRRTVMSLERDVAYCLEGAGMPEQKKEGDTSPPLKTEEQKVLDKMLTALIVSSDYSPIWVAAAGSKAFIEYAWENLTPKDIQYISAAGLQTVTDPEARKAAKKALDTAQKLAKSYNDWSKSHAGNTSDPKFSAIIAQTLSPRLSAMMAQGAKDVHTLMLRMTFLVYFRINVVNVTPKLYEPTPRQITYDWGRAIEIEAKYAANAAVKEFDSKHPTWKKKKSRQRTWNGAYSRTVTALMAAMEQASHVVLPTTLTFAPTKAEPLFNAPSVLSEMAPASHAPATTHTPATTPDLPANLPAETVRVLSPAQGFLQWSRSLDGASSILGGLLLIWHIDITLDALQHAKWKNDKRAMKNLRLALLSGGLSLGSLVSTSAAGVIRTNASSSGAGGMSKLKMASKLMKVGAVLAVLSAVVDAYLIGERGLDTWKKGGDVGYHAAALVTTLVGGGLLAGSIWFATTGSSLAVTGAATSAVGVGWLLLLAGLFCAGVGCLLSVLASDKEVSDLEVWVSRSYFGKGIRSSDEDLAPYATLQEEIAGFIEVIHVIGLKVIWHDNFGDDQLELNIDLFGYDQAKSDFCLTVIFKGKWIKTRQLKDVQLYDNYTYQLRISALSKDKDLRPNLERKEGQTSPISWMWHEMNAKKAGLLNYRVEITFNESHYAGADIKLEYRPDKSNPDWVVTFGPTNTLTIKD
jgi:hypothetical protein